MPNKKSFVAVRRGLAKPETQGPGFVLKQLRQYITENRLQPGEKLLPERKLAEIFQVSRPAVREAIQALAVLEVLASRRGDGTYIRALTNLNGGWPDDPRLDEVDFDTIELLEVRKMIEPQAAALAAGRASERELSNIEHHLAEMAAHITTVAVREQQDFFFHDAILRAAGNRILSAVAKFLTPMMIKSRRITGPAHRDMNRIMKQHTAIYEAIRLGNAQLAEEAMRQHLLNVGIDLISEPRS